MFHCLLVLGLIATVPFMSFADQPKPGKLKGGGWPDERASQLVFFAVIEGLYRDGVSNETVDLILKKDYNEHFVYCCPLCHPAYEAFILYRSRSRFYGLKGDIDNFGFGLDEKLEKKLRSENRSDRLEAIQTMIQQYVRQRVKMMRLSAKEEAELSAEMAKGRNKGMDALPRTPILANEKRCAICDGSVGAFKKPGEK